MNDSYEAFILLTDPTAVDTDGDGIWDGVEVNGAYGDPPLPTDPRNNNTDGDQFDDGEEDVNGNGVVDPGETDPTRIEDSGDIDNDGLDNWEENMTCTLWNVTDTDGGGVNDGDELSFAHSTDPCLSVVEIEKQIISWDSANSILALNSTSGLNPNPIDWRQHGAPMGYYVSTNGSRTPFMYESIQFDTLRSVDVAKPNDASTVVFLNFSWCWNATAGAFNEPHCDDDYPDTDGDGLADWEEFLSTWGYLSLPNMSDTDGDGVDDLNEILNQTDPSIPCDNNLDSDGDGLNNYFENTTGCPLNFGMGGNGTLDTYYTMWNVTDTDNGGVGDGQEYVDGTNPQNNSADDLNPLDTDGDGIPDTIEQQIGTDWRDPDTDGGGVPDGQECPPEYWDIGCVDADGNPWDPSDDIDDNMLYFIAQNTSSGVDPAQRHYWRWHTYDSYTGVSWGVNITLVGYTQMFPEWSTTQGVSDSFFWSGSEVLGWTIGYKSDGIMGPGEELIAPYNAVNFTSWLDSGAGLNFSNFTRDILIDQSAIDTLYVTAPQVIFGPQITDNSTAFSGSSYAYDLPADFLFRSSSYVDAVTQTVINESGAFSAWDKVLALQDYLINGNSSTKFALNHEGSGRIDGQDEDSDIAHWILNTTLEGSCDEFTTVFSVMLRLAGLPTRKVTGFAGGTWTGESFEVYGKDFTRWVEVHLETNQNQGGLDMGWIPFEACPEAAAVEVVDEEWGPTWVERDLSTGTIWLNGTLQFVDNATPAENISMNLYLVKSNETANVPGSAAVSQHLVANGTTDQNGSFQLNGTPEIVIDPGFGSLVLHILEKAYVGSQGVSFEWRLNVSDDVNLSLREPPPTDEPPLGAGVDTLVSGDMSWASTPYTDPSRIDNMHAVLNYTTASDGPVSLIAEIGAGGYYEFSLSINESEPLGLINASLNFFGWHEEDLNNASTPSYHIRPATVDFMFNITPAPNLTVTLEGADANNSILDIDSPIYLNGTVLSRGPSSEALNGTLILKMRRATTNGPYTTLKTWYLNDSNWTLTPGQFAVSWQFAGSEVPIPSGEVQVKVEFDSEGLFANDQITFIDQYGIRSFINFSYTLGPTLRGNEASVEVVLTDHTNTSLAGFSGTYALVFNGTESWNATDPDLPRLAVFWTPPWEMFAGDYNWVLNFSGSTWLHPAMAVDEIRILGRANATVELGLEWTPRGTTNWVVGFANDIFHDIPILGNNSSILVQLEVPSDLPPAPDGSPASPVIYRLASGWIDPATGGYNLSFVMPSGVGSGVYDLKVTLGFSTSPPPEGYYFKEQEADYVRAGIQTEFVVETAPSSLIVVAGSTMILNATITDVEDDALLKGVFADMYFDWGGPLQQIFENSTSGADGVAIFSPTIPASTPPGYYTLRVHAPEDITDNLSASDAGRWLGNDSFADLTVQVSSFIEIDSIPLEVTAGQAFTMSGRVIDAVDSNRTVNGPMAVEVFFLNDSSETLVESQTTTSNGSFTISVPTDPLGDGVTSGTKTVVVSVINGSTPFYLTGTGNTSILVRGVTQFVDKTPIINTVVDRGSSISFGARLVESSDNDRQIGDATVAAKFHDTWLTPVQTNGVGVNNFSFEVPHSHPLGLIAITLMFNGSSTLHSTATIITTITVRSPTNLALDLITDNPAAGESFTVSGILTSSNGSGITDRDGNTLSPALTFSIDGQSNTFTVTGGAVSPNGSWSADIRLDLTFPRGTHDLIATYTPNVNYYGSSTGNGTFDSRGYSLLTIVDPLDLDPDSRTIRGDVVSVNISLVDNAGQPVVAEPVDLLVDGTFEWRGTTDVNGSMNAVLPVDYMRAPGPMTITAQFAGINGTTGLLGDETWTRVIILAPTELDISTITGSVIAGETVTFSGTLLDEHGQFLIQGGNPAGGIIHLAIDGVSVGPVYSTQSNASTGEWAITYDLPLDTDYGMHTVTVNFRGGFTWVDPMGQGDSLNPEYYLPSSHATEFNALQTSQVVLTTPPGEIDRNELLLIEGMLTDGSGRVLPNRNLEVSMNGQFLTGLSVDEDGTFSLYIPVPPDMELGPRVVLISYQGEEFVLGSNSSTIFTVYGPVEVSVVKPSSVAVGDSLTLRGTVKDNLPGGWLANHSLQIFVDGVLVGITSTDENGEWNYVWIVSNFLEVGNHTLTVRAPEQGYHRLGSTETVLTVAYHTGMTLQVDSTVITRGGTWNFTGRLFDDDSSGRPGLEDRELTLRLDGEVVGMLTTSIDGTFSYTHDAGYAIARGPHNIAFSFAGETYYLPMQYNMTVYTRADIVIEAFPNNLLIIRGDPDSPIKLNGRILEIGGEGNVMHNMTISLHWEDSLLPLIGNPWQDDGTEHFGLITNAIQVMPPGPLTLTIRVEPDGSRYLNGDIIEVEVMILISVVFDFEPDSLYLAEGERLLQGSVNVSALDTGQSVSDFPLSAYLVNGTCDNKHSSTRFSVVGLTDQNGLFTYHFEAVAGLAPFYNQSFWGEMRVCFSTDSDFVDPINKTWLANYHGGLDIEYEQQASQSFQPALYALVVLIVLGVVAGALVLVRRRRQAAIDELSSVFSYTAELLAAGDEVREAIFNCYESLCQILMRRGFLRRDFETVREFEMAIRNALPISEQALVALDRIFEEARYSSHVLGEPHRQNAQMALSTVLQEIDELQDIPERDSYLIDADA
uniref:Putative transglutaminase-like superfamily protein n=1 Tax=uncultured marine microorganism HF4000_ANIW141L21 TaxID=455539 RepID=B3T5U1_9ZZZZ|nr:putative transglutaminase-like superfamily protein [uncultured marine microorganism HF4000_ANIW141L21]